MKKKPVPALGLQAQSLERVLEYRFSLFMTERGEEFQDKLVKLISFFKQSGKKKNNRKHTGEEEDQETITLIGYHHLSMASVSLRSQS